jgi:ubiquinol-cytochrome c reductase cytochrome b subunit
MLNWLNQRTGIVTQINEFLTEDVPGGASYWYVFGSATLFCMVMQIATGIWLTFYYSPSIATAWESTLFIYQKVYLGQFIISLHYWGATAMIALLLMHLVQVLVWGAYKKPREIQWVVGVLLLIFTLVLGLTGYLLPWDLNAFFASQVAINITGTVPILGQWVQYFLQDGVNMGTLTINRFFGLHVWLTPALLVLLVASHLAIFRWNGPAGPPLDDPPKLKPGRFWPTQMFMDTVASFAVFAIVVVLSIVSPAPLDAKADPNNTAFVPSPAWYFNALYALLEIVPEQFSLIATIIGPGVAVAVILLLPWIDRNPSRQLRRRPIVLSITALALFGAVFMSFYGQNTINAKAAAAHQEAPKVPGGAMANSLEQAAPTAATAGATGGGGANTAAIAAGQKVYTASCAGCHGAAGAGIPGTFPPLAKNSAVTAADPKDIVHTVLYGRTGALQVNGATFNGQMPAWKGNLSNADIANVITFIRNSWGNSASAVTEKDVAAVPK